MSKKSFSISFVILLAAITSIFLISRRGEPVVVKTNLENLPMEIAGFKATDVFFSKAVYDELNADKHVYRHYRSSDGQQVDLYIGYYGALPKAGARITTPMPACPVRAGESSIHIRCG
jgi:hypothetical protein